VNTFCRATLALLLAVVLTGVVSAEPQQPTSLQADEAHWQELLAQKEALEKEIENKVRTIQERMQTAPPQERTSIQAEYQRLAQDYLKKYQAVTNQLLPLAAMIYQRNPQDTAAAEIVMQQAFSKNQYQKAAEIADRLIGVGHVTPITLNMGGAAHFNIHNFQKAHQLLERAQKEKMLDQLGSQYLSVSNEHEAIWEKERALRAAEAAMEPDRALPQVLLKTSRGDILLELFEDQAPNTVANFIRLTESNAYDGTKFHRVIPNFMAQGGDPNSKDDDSANDGTGGPPYTIACECSRPDARMHFSGSLSMAHAGKDTGGSQFFLTHRPTSHLNGRHTVFGRVSEGLDNAMALQKEDAIESATVVRKRNHPYQPQTTPRQR